MPVLVLTAVEVEAHRLAHHLRLAPAAGATWPHYRSGAIEVMCVGLRADLLATRAADACLAAPALVVSAGACGALDPGLRRGDLVIPRVVIGSTGVRHEVDTIPALHGRGALLTVAEVAQTAAIKTRLWMETGAVAVDMESAPIVEWARGAGRRVAVVRAVSDTAQQAIPADVAALVDAGGRVRPGQALRTALARPRAIADALALGRGADAALRTVAAALGKIVHDSRDSDRPEE
jgi:adenosylhomocysteine nucleosidase